MDKFKDPICSKLSFISGINDWNTRHIKSSAWIFSLWESQVNNSLPLLMFELDVKKIMRKEKERYFR